MNGEMHPRKRALIIGGSLGGLFAGNMLQQAGWDVDIFERSAQDLDSRGGGIVLQPEVVALIRRSGIERDWDNLGVRSAQRVVFRPDGSVEHKQYAPQVQTSWSLIYSLMRSTISDIHYHKNRLLTDITFPDDHHVTAHFEGGARETGDLLIGLTVTVRLCANGCGTTRRTTRGISPGAGWCRKTPCPNGPDSSFMAILLSPATWGRTFWAIWCRVRITIYGQATAFTTGSGIGSLMTRSGKRS